MKYRANIDRLTVQAFWMTWVSLASRFVSSPVRVTSKKATSWLTIDLKRILRTRATSRCPASVNAQERKKDATAPMA